MSLGERLRADITAFGPVSIAQYMSLCLYDPKDGYYAAHPRLGAQGDFLTAPLTSQMFGELLGLWVHAVWGSMGRPAKLSLIEIGPGDGTLMSDMLRAIRLSPDMLAGLDVVLVDISPPLKALQRDRLVGTAVRWADSLAQALKDLDEDTPVILIANEVLDCLPARQFVRTDKGWCERMVGLTPEGQLTFGLAPRPVEGLFPEAPEGSVLELSAAQDALGTEMAHAIARQGGAALLIDYGRAEPGFGDTLQALQGHQKQGPLDHPGLDDLTLHADFPSVIQAIKAVGIETALARQGDFLNRLGIGPRAEALSRSRPDQAPVIARQLDRLIGKDQMGDLFKVLGLWSPGLATPPGFDDDR